MIVYARNMPQEATYYPATGQDRYGSDTYGDGEALSVRWQGKPVLVRNYEGREVVSEAVVYCSALVAVRGKLGLGSATLAEAKEIISVQTSPSLRGDEVLVKAYL